MRSPFVRFTLFVVLATFVGLALFLYFTGRFPFRSAVQPPANSAPSPAPDAKMANVPAPGASREPVPLDAPPDISGLNYPEVAVPGGDLPSPTPPVKMLAKPGDYVAELTSHKLASPIEGLQPGAFSDNFNDARGGAPHQATDLMEPKGTAVHAIDEGNIVKLFTSKKGGLTIYQFDNSQKYCYYFAHLDRYAPGVKEGMLVRPGQVIGFVGSTGDANAAAPHLHLAISLLDPDKKYWKGTPLNPYPVLKQITSGAH